MTAGQAAGLVWLVLAIAYVIALWRMSSGARRRLVCYVGGIALALGLLGAMIYQVMMDARATAEAYNRTWGNPQEQLRDGVERSDAPRGHE